MNAAKTAWGRSVGAVVALAAAALVALVAMPEVAVAALFSSSAARPTGAFSAATLQPVSGVGVTWWCPGGHGFGAGGRPAAAEAGGYTATIAWDPSPSAFVQAYVVEWAPSASGPWTELATTTSTAVQQTSIPKKTDRWWRVTASAHEWRSAPVTVAATAPNPNC